MNGRTVAMVSWLVALTSLAALAEEGAVAGRAAGAAPVYKAGPASGTPQPFLKQLSLSKAADYLDAGGSRLREGLLRLPCHVCVPGGQTGDIASVRSVLRDPQGPRALHRRSPLAESRP